MKLTVQVNVPRSLRSCTDGRENLEIEAGDVSEAVTRLFERFPRLRTRLADQRAGLRPRLLMYFDERGPIGSSRESVTLRIRNRVAILDVDPSS